MCCPSQVFAQTNTPSHAWKGDWPHIMSSLQLDFSILPFIITVTLIAISISCLIDVQYKVIPTLYPTCINRKSSTFSVMDLWTALIGHSKCKHILRPLHLKDFYPSTLLHISWRSEDEGERSKIRRQMSNDFRTYSLVKRRSQEWTPWWKVTCTCLDIQKENGNKFVSQSNWWSVVLSWYFDWTPAVCSFYSTNLSHDENEKEIICFLV